MTGGLYHSGPLRRGQAPTLEGPSKEASSILPAGHRQGPPAPGPQVGAHRPHGGRVDRFACDQTAGPWRPAPAPTASAQPRHIFGKNFSPLEW
ncbi:MAG: hypothetical protein OZSIB_4008 [Candidatus Ozemobacter sibiricus]|uniref:Uncharacterized protein n=1 Tax=Candidatus Ozemobacter sibiricus TaxID=2268124 RepID=A0A367ZNZ7_9BACT|nr:MAG: hypothetical protein OZSIB_4008 [Candidatus Ozemobacter sibiricus]